MKLPNLDKAVIPPAKLTQYLLSTAHPYGRHKAAFFRRFGFREDSWRELAAALLAHADEHEVAGVEDTPFGTRYNKAGLELRMGGTLLFGWSGFWKQETTGRGW